MVVSDDVKGGEWRIGNSARENEFPAHTDLHSLFQIPYSLFAAR
jgi:hypothetical protein